MLLAEARQIGPMLRRVGEGRLPFLRVGLVDSLSRALNGVLAGFLAEVAEQSSLLSGLTASHTTGLITRQLDLFLGAEEVEDAEGLERHLLLQEAYIILSPATLPPPSSVEELAALAEHHPLVRFSARSRTGLEIERHLRRLRLDIPRHQEFDTPHGVAAAVAAGLGWAITTPLCMAEAALPEGAAPPLPPAARPGPHPQAGPHRPPARTGRPAGAPGASLPHGAAGSGQPLTARLLPTAPHPPPGCR
jgi:DNA-binding transcriptional LysR family regulator